MRSSYSNTFTKLVLVLSACLSIGFQKATAQLYPMGAVYFQNQYLVNPALAGSNGGLSINAGYRSQWSNIPGAPTAQTLTADYAITDKAGLGINFYNDKAGLFKKTRGVASYAYHLPLNIDGSRLHFGVSLGFTNDRISNGDINADPNDATLVGYNESESYIDGDFGIAYLGKKLSIQAALPNMKSLLTKDESRNSVDQSIFFSSISYKMTLSEGANGFNLEPKVVFRGIKGFDNIIDAGANLSYADDKLNFFGMYHTSKNMSFGIGFQHQAFTFGGIYTSETSGLRNYTTGNFELALGLKLLK